MQINENTKIERVCSKNDTRHALNYVYFDGENLIATNGHILAINPVLDLDEKDTPGLIQPEVITAARKKENRGMVLANGSVSLPFSQTTFARPEGSYPAAALPANFANPEQPSVIPAYVTKEYTICLDADLLKTLADAICTGRTNTVKLWIGGPQSAIRVEPAYSNGNYGVLMPFNPKGA